MSMALEAGVIVYQDAQPCTGEIQMIDPNESFQSRLLRRLHTAACYIKTIEILNETNEWLSRENLNR